MSSQWTQVWHLGMQLVLNTWPCEAGSTVAIHDEISHYPSPPNHRGFKKHPKSSQKPKMNGKGDLVNHTSPSRCLATCVYQPPWCNIIMSPLSFLFSWWNMHELVQKSVSLSTNEWQRRVCVWDGGRRSVRVYRATAAHYSSVCEFVCVCVCAYWQSPTPCGLGSFSPSLLFFINNSKSAVDDSLSPSSATTTNQQPRVWLASHSPTNQHTLSLSLSLPVFFIGNHHLVRTGAQLPSFSPIALISF